MDLPPPPLFQDAVEKNIIPQVSIQSVLAKYDGHTTQVRIKIMSRRRTLSDLTCTTGVCRPCPPLQAAEATALYHSTLQALYKEHLCRGKESHNRELSVEGTRLQRLCVSSNSAGGLLLTAVTR